jgi:UvrD-like helicase family protein
VSGVVPPETSLQPSPEQHALLAARRADPAGSLRVLAFAGTGKTTVLRLLAAADRTPALYLAYNKSTQLAAQARFPVHVACRTVHSLAFRATRMAGQQHRLERKLTGGELAEMLAIPALDGLRPSFWGQGVLATVRSFTHSPARAIGPEHLPPSPGTDRGELVLALAQELWAKMRDPADDVPLEHDAYLKLWHLQGARLPAGAEVLYVDEAQDANPVTLAILEAQRRPTIWVGDPWQAIYRFRGSVNALRLITAPPHPLSRSWRFGEELACVARAILARTSAPPALAFRGDPPIATTLGPVGPPCTVLCRTNAGLFAAAVRGRDRIHVLGGVEPLARLVLGGWRLHRGERVPEVASLARFRSWDELVAEARDPELRFLVQVVVHYGRALPGLVAELRRRAVAHPGMAERVLATAHKAKGLEWPRVRLAEDFPSLEELDAVDRDGAPWLTPEERDQELHLLYVAATRARQRLEPNAAVRSCLAGRATARPEGAA